MKKLVCILVLSVLMSITVSAADISVFPGNEFIVYESGKDSSAVAKTLDMDENDFSKLCETDNIVYFAVNGDKSKQVRIMRKKTDFSDSIGNLSELSDDKIKKLIPDITGDDSINGEIVTTGGQKFVKTKMMSRDSGGEYTVSQYITVAADNNIVLSVFDSSKDDKDFADKVFSSLNFPDFGNTHKNIDNYYQHIILVIIALLLPFTVYIIYTLMCDLRGFIIKKD